MVIDSSALIVLLLGEPETEQFVSAIAAASERLLSAASYLETAIVMSGRFGPQGLGKLDRLVSELSLEIVPFNGEQARLGIVGFQQYGRGSGHPAALITAIALPMPSQNSWGSPCCSRETISRAPI